jgi:hypothetical protein
MKAAALLVGLSALVLAGCQTARPAQQAGAASSAPATSLAQVIGGPGQGGTTPANAALAPALPGAPAGQPAGLPTQLAAYQGDAAARPAAPSTPAATPVVASAAPSAAAPPAPALAAPTTPVAAGPVATLHEALTSPRGAGGPALAAPATPATGVTPVVAAPSAQSVLEPARLPPPRTQTIPVQRLQPDPHVQRAVTNARRPYTDPAVPSSAPGLSTSDIRRLF